MSVVWHLHRDDLRKPQNTALGFLVGSGKRGHILELQTVENLGKRIPARQTYLCRLDYFHGGGYPTFEIIWPWDMDGDGEPDRDRLLFHTANAVRNQGGELSLRGCVAPGLKRVENIWETFYPELELPPVARGLPGVANSGTAFKEFMAHNEGLKEFMLKVTED